MTPGMVPPTALPRLKVVGGSTRVSGGRSSGSCSGGGCSI